MSNLVIINPCQRQNLITEDEHEQGLKGCALLVAKGVIPAIRYLQSQGWGLDQAVEYLAEFECMIEDCVK